MISIADLPAESWLVAVKSRKTSHDDHLDSRILVEPIAPGEVLQIAEFLIADPEHAFDIVYVFRRAMESETLTEILERGGSIAKELSSEIVVMFAGDKLFRTGALGGKAAEA